MKVLYVHASKFGNGAAVAAEVARRLGDEGVTVAVHHVDGLKAQSLPEADLYVFSSPGRMGRPIRRMRRFLGSLTLPAGTRYALLTTEAAPRPDPKTGALPTEEELAKTQRVRPIMAELLDAKGLVETVEAAVLVTGLKGPLEDGWQAAVEEFVAALPRS